MATVYKMKKMKTEREPAGNVLILFSFFVSRINGMNDKRSKGYTEPILNLYWVRLSHPV